MAKIIPIFNLLAYLKWEMGKKSDDCPKFLLGWEKKIGEGEFGRPCFILKVVSLPFSRFVCLYHCLFVCICPHLSIYSAVLWPV